MSNISGLYYLVSQPYSYYAERQYLPQVGIDVRATISSTASRTVVTQHYKNPSAEKAIKELCYVFPLYENASIVAFQLRIGDRVITGEVQERDTAKRTFDKAVSKGQTAGLLDEYLSAADTFTTIIGNVPPGAKVIVEISYVAELKHDAGTESIRYTIPTRIAPRWDDDTIDESVQSGMDVDLKGMKVTVDVAMESNTVVREVSSPSHSIAVSMGVTSVSDDDAALNKASARLSLDSTALDRDFILQVKLKDPQTPRAMVESHPSIEGQKALMATLVPRFKLPPSRPEIVFLCDRSGSMQGQRIRKLVSAIQVFLRSLPVGVNFNICSFGSSHSFLWERSKRYSAASLEEATKHVERFDADMGGTEMFFAIRATIENRYKDMDLDVFLVTDGDIWQQNKLFKYLNDVIVQPKAPIRIFTLGIGNTVSHSLIKGVARASNGFSQVVGLSEPFETKVIRMLKAGLMPHINDYSLEVKYQDDTDDDDFKIIEKVADSLKVKLQVGEKLTKQPNEPHKHGPLELEIPVDDVGKGALIHQLAAKKAITDLEEGRGWLMDAKEGKQLLKDKFEGRFPTLVQREAVRLGVGFQVSGKNCSWVAVEKNASEEMNADHDWEFLDEPVADADAIAEARASKRTKYADDDDDDDSGEDTGFGLVEGDDGPVTSAGSMSAIPSAFSGASFRGGPAKKEVRDFFMPIIRMQEFDGSWKLTPELVEYLGIDFARAASALSNTNAEKWATVLVVVFLERKMSDKKDSWELVVEKALDWLEGTGFDVDRKGNQATVWQEARKIIG